MKMQQVKLKKGNTTTYSWVPAKDKLKKGDFIKFKKSDEYWEIDEIYKRIVEKEGIHKSWHVGGL